MNYRTELSYFHPTESLTDSIGTLAVSAGVDYIFKNSLMLQAEVLYNNVSSNNAYGLMAMYSAPLSAKNLSISQWNIFTNASYPITPRLNGSLYGMYFVDIQSYYAGLSLEYSVIENLDFSFIAQYFSTLGNSTLWNMHILMA